MVQVGTLPDDTVVPVNALLTKELQYVGSWRFANVFERVIEMVVSGRIDPRPLVTRIHDFDNLPQAIAEAASGAEILKMQIRRIA